VKKHQKYTLHNTGLPIHRQIIAASIQKLDEMYRFFSTPETTLLRVVTDSICFISEPLYFDQHPKMFQNGPKNIEALGKYQEEKIVCTKFHQRAIDALKIENHLKVNLECLNKAKPRVLTITPETESTYENLVSNKGGIVIGFPGCGKTHLALRLAADERFKKPLFLALTNSCVNMFRNKCTRSDVKCSTLDMFFETERDTAAWSKLMMYDGILIDEYVMMQHDLHVTALYKMYQHHPEALPCIYLFGDSQQCRLLVGPHQYEYEQTTCVQQLTRNMLVEMQFKEAYSRYDVETYNILKEFALMHTLKREWFQPLDMAHLPKMNLCYTNQCVDSINTKLVREHGMQPDTPMIATEKRLIGDKMVYTNELYQYQDFPPEVMLSKSFKPGHAATTHCIQGSTIQCDYGLH
jgi:hypothetical protein